MRQPLDVPGLVRRVRRVCDLSQAELAARLEVRQSTVTRWETGASEPSLAVFRKLLALADWELSVLDRDANPVRPMRPDGVRDAAGRHRPAHLDVHPQDPEDLCGGRPVTDRIVPKRNERDWKRKSAGVPDDHLTESDIAAAVAEKRKKRRDRWAQAYERELADRLARGLPHPLEADPCFCCDDCFDTPGCVTTCPCKCELALFEPGGTELVGWADEEQAARAGIWRPVRPAC